MLFVLAFNFKVLGAVSRYALQSFYFLKKKNKKDFHCYRG